MGVESHQGQSVSVTEVTHVLLPRALQSQANSPALVLISLMAIF